MQTSEGERMIITDCDMTVQAAVNHQSRARSKRFFCLGTLTSCVALKDPKDHLDSAPSVRLVGRVRKPLFLQLEFRSIDTVCFHDGSSEFVCPPRGMPGSVLCLRMLCNR